MMNFKKKYFFFSILLLCGLLGWLGVSLAPQVRLVNVSDYPNQVALKQLKDKLQAAGIHKNIDIYAGNFNASDMPTVQTSKYTNVLFLGSRKDLQFNDLSQYDFIFTSTLILHSFLTTQNYKNYLVPTFIETNDFKTSACVQHPENENCYMLVIGEQQNVLSVLNERKISYRHELKLTPMLEKELSSQIENISGIIVNDSTPMENTLDISPFFFYAIAHDVPILSDNIAPTSETTNMNNFNITSLFADTLSYYTYTSDIEDFLNCIECRLKKAYKAHFLLNHLYTTDAVASSVTSILSNNQTQPIITDLVTILSPTHAGLYNNGDYWIAKDLETAFEKKYTQALTVFGLSNYPYLGEVSIYLRGTTPLLEKHSQDNQVSLMYLIFPFTDKVNAEDYAQSMQYEFNNVDGVAIASPKVAKAAHQLGINAYYVPQFTNTSKFYPDYNEDKKSEVLFVGQNDFYRRAARAVFDAGLPITIYGSNWDGLAKGDYIDNKILRQYYSSAKILLNDTRPNMLDLGFISNRIFDGTACSTLVISDYMPEIEEVYGDSIPMWKTEEELIELVKYYLNPVHEAERKAKAERARQITLKNFTSDIVADKFQEIINNVKRTKP